MVWKIYNLSYIGMENHILCGKHTLPKKKKQHTDKSEHRRHLFVMIQLNMQDTFTPK